MKKLLALILCVAMVLSTMGTVVFADDADAEYAAKLGDDQYFESVTAALDAAYGAGEKDVVITLIGDTDANTTESIDLYNKYDNGTAFDKITFRQEDASKPYYLQSLYTGWTKDKVVFEGVNIAVTYQFYAIGKVELINNSIITRTGDVTNFVFNGDMYIEPGSKYVSLVDRVSSGSSLTVDGGRTDGEYNSTADYKTVWLYVEDGNTMTIKNGAYVIVSNYEYAELDVSGTVDVQGSRLDVFTAIKIGANGVFKVDTNSVINTPKIIGTGKLVIDGADMGEGEVAALKKVNLSGFTGAVELANADGFETEIVDGKIKLVAKNVASITSGNVTTNYTNIEDAIANWTNGTTLTLLADVQISNTITLNSNEKHTLDLGEYTLSTATGKTAIKFSVMGRETAGDALEIKAKPEGGIDAGTVISYSSRSGKDRSIIKINGGTYYGSISISCPNNTNAAQLYISDGTFYGTISGRSPLVKISGGVFHKQVSLSVASNSYAQIIGGKFKDIYSDSDLTNNQKFFFGTNTDNRSDYSGVDVYIDEDGYYVVTTEVDNNKSANFAASVSEKTIETLYDSKTHWNGFERNNGLLEYTKAVNEGLFYKDAAMAFEDFKNGIINLYEDSNAPANTSGDLVVDCTAGNAIYSGNVKLNSNSSTFTIKLKENDEYKGIVTPYSGYVLLEEVTIEDGIKTIKYSNSDNKDIAVASVEDYSFMTLQKAINATNGNGTAMLNKDTTEDVTVYGSATSTYALGSGVTIDLNNFDLNGSVTVESGATVIIKNGTINSTQSAIIVKDGGTAIIESAAFKTTAQDLFAVEEGGSLVIKDGEFSHDPSQYADEGLEGVYRGEREYPYIIAERKAQKIDLILDETSDENVYDIKLKSADGYDIYEFVSTELTFADSSVTVGGGDMQYEIIGIEGKTVAQRADAEDKKDQFIISIPNADDRTHRLSTDMSNNIDEIVIGQVKFIGQGTLDLSVIGGKVVATWQGTDLGRYYENASLNLAGAVVDSSVAEKKRDVTVNVAYNHALDGKYWDDNEITVSIKDGFGNTDKYGVKDLTSGTAEFKDVQLGRLTVTLEAPGFRKYVYYTTLEEGESALVLNFWNNVKRNEAVGGVVIDPEEEIEAGKEETYAHNFLVGDIVMDYTVDEYDLAAVTSYYGTYGIQNVSKYLKYDLNRDGNIDIIDVHYVLHTLNN